MTADRSCWSCRYHQAGGLTLLGKCLWFVTKELDPKDIPPMVVDAACQHWEVEA